jgi:hypothetical protein
MLAVSDPNLIIGGYAVASMVLFLCWRLIVWVRESPTHPDPWEADVDKKLADPDTPEICPHCSTPQPPTAWFCEHCGRAVGPYNNLMPYVQVFSEGEVLRNGTSNRLRRGWLIPIGYLLISLNFVVAGIALVPNSTGMSLLIFAGVFAYWMLILKNVNRQNKLDSGSPKSDHP